MCREARIPVVPGALTPTEIAQAWELGASLVKVFPAGPLGARYVKELLTSLPHVRLAAAGGVSLENVGDFIWAGADAVGVSAEMISEDCLVRREFSEVTRRVREQRRWPVPPVRPSEGPDVR